MFKEMIFVEIGSIIVLLVLVAALIEAVWEALKPALGGVVSHLQDRGVPVDRIAGLVLSLIVCLGIGSQVDLFALLGLTLGIPYLGLILTAIILARGSNFVHDLIGALDGVRQGNKLQLEFQNNNIDAGM